MDHGVFHLSDMVMKYSCSPSLADFRLHPHSSAKQRLLLPVHQLLVTGMLVGKFRIYRSTDVNICIKNMLLICGTGILIHT